MIASPFKALNDFRRDDRGSIIPTFGVMFFVITMCAGVAVDYGRIRHSETRLSFAADAAALAAGKALLDGRNSDADVQDIATKIFQANFKETDGYAHVQSFTAKLDRGTNSVEIDIQAEVPMTITKIAGFERVSLPVSSVATFDQKDIELGLQLDLTGSMAGRKIRDLRDATSDLIDIMLPDAGTPNKVRLALAPYASGVNLGAYARAVTNNRQGVDNCVYDRPGANADRDTTPSINNYFQGRQDLPGALACPGSRLVPLSSDKVMLKDEVRRFRDGGFTAGQMGTMFAWATISPEWSGIWPSESAPAPYRDGKTIKAAILMTDGEYNTFNGASGNTNAANPHARAMCANMKAEGVVVYTVGFMINLPEALNTLGQCASSSDKFFRAEDGAALREPFANIANQLNNLRLAK